MKNKYIIGLDGNLISKSFISNVLNEQGKTAAELAAEARAKRAASGSAQPATTKSTSTASSNSSKSELQKYKDIIEKGNLRAFESVLYQSVFQPIMFIFHTGCTGFKIWDKPGWKDEKKNYFGNRLTSEDHPFRAFNGYLYWYKPTKNNFFGSEGTFKANMEGQDNWFFNNVFVNVLKDLDKTSWYSNRKNSPSVVAIFDNLYKQVDALISAWYNENTSYRIEFPYVSKNLLIHPVDEIAAYFEQTTATRSTLKYKEFNSTTFIEQASATPLYSLRGVKGITPSFIEMWKEPLRSTTYKASIFLDLKQSGRPAKTVDYVPLSFPS